LYNPYEGLSTAVDPRVLRSVYKLPSQPEFLFSEQATVHRRSWSENLTYYTGTGYATGKQACFEMGFEMESQMGSLKAVRLSADKYMVPT
jgi:import inner membrane translocase subunit TIM23